MQPALPAWFEIASFATLAVVLLVDLLLVFRRPHIPSAREATGWVLFYIGLALLFSVALLLVGDGERAGQFVGGWLTEYSLSVDNLFVFVVIMARFSVPRKLQQEALLVGIVVALILRGIVIVLGVQLIGAFTWIFYLFGAFLLYTAAHQALSKPHRDGGDNAIVRFLRRSPNLTDRFDGFRLRTTVDGRRMLTPLLLVLVALGATDLLFALDSIPAIFGITTDPFLVFSANVFALMGLRQLYFLLGHVLDRLEYLRFGIAFILGFIGVKLVAHALHTNSVPFVNGGHPVPWAPEIGTGPSLVVIAGAIAVATIASLVKLRAGKRT